MSELEPTLWREIMDHLRQRHAPICRQWFEDLEPAELSGGLLQIRTNNAIQQTYLQRKCVAQFTEAAQSATGALVAVTFISSDQVEPESDLAVREVPQDAGPGTLTETPPSEALLHEMDQKHAGDVRTNPVEMVMPPAQPRTPPVISIHSPNHAHGDEFEYEQIVLSPDYSFENFITGPGNELAHAASIAVANKPGVAYNPLFIHGGVGLGKTHLLQATCQTIMQVNPRMRICYLSCDTFMNHFIDCVQSGQMNQFRHRYRHVDVLVIDDIHILTNRERTQEEFFHTFNALYQSNKQIVLSSDSPPSEIPQLEERLVSRFSWGLVSNITRPDYETRVAIVRAKARLRGLAMPDDVIAYIATRIESNARELEGAITTLQGHAHLRHQPITLALAQHALGEPISHGGSQVTLQHITDAVTRYYNVKLSDLQSKRRHKSITEPRQVCMWLARKRTRFSLEEVGAHFGGRDHSTVMHAIRIVKERSDQSRQFAAELQELDAQITHRLSLDY